MWNMELLPFLQDLVFFESLVKLLFGLGQLQHRHVVLLFRLKEKTRNRSVKLVILKPCMK